VHDRSNLHFHLINPKTGHRVRMVTRDAETDEDVSRADLVKGYEFKKDHFLLLDDADFDAARIESSSVMAVEKFVEAASIDPIYFDTSYSVGPDGSAGADVFVVLQAAIAKSGMIALSRLVMAQRERVVALSVRGRGLVAHTLHEARDLNDADMPFDDLPSTRPDPEMVKLALQLIKRQSGAYDPADWEDRYEARLRDVIDARLKGEGITADNAADEPAGNVIDLMASLKKSLDTKPSTRATAKPRATKKPANRRVTRTSR
jgi:DNA end-binding protein Ku